MNDVTQCIIIKYINNILLKHISKLNRYQVYESNLQVYIKYISRTSTISSAFNQSIV